MTLTNILEKLKTVSFLVLQVLQAVLSCSMRLWKMALSFIVSRLAPSYKGGFDREKVPERRLDELELWNSFSYYPAVTTWDLLSATSGKYIGKDKKWHHGKYLFTVDWGHPDANILNSDHSEIPHEHKCAHIIALEDGNYAAQPNNRLYMGSAFFYCEGQHS